MHAVHSINPEADVISSNFALAMNTNAAKSLSGLLKTNLGPRGTLKMLVSGAGDIKTTKDGQVLLSTMQIQHPTAALIARTATAQDEISGDGTTSCVLLTGEIMRQCERYVAEGLHPRHLIDGIEAARVETLEFLENFRKPFADDDQKTVDRNTLLRVAQTSLRTKLDHKLADHLADIITDACLAIRKPGEPLDLYMIETMEMPHQSVYDTQLVKGLVLDHGVRHPNMARRSKNCFIFVCNISLEYEKTEVNSSFFYSSAEEREAMIAAERKHVDDKVRQIIALKEQVCSEDTKPTSFVVINQKGIDPIALEMFQKAGIPAIRRAKRRNMERIPLACGGYAVNSTEDLTPDCLGWAEDVYEHTLGEEKYTFVEGVKNPFSVTILIKGPNAHTIVQIKEALRDGERAILNALEDKSLVPGAGAFETAAHLHLTGKFKQSVEGRAKIGVQAFADALLAIPKTLAGNAGHDAQASLIKLLEATRKAKEGETYRAVGLDLTSDQDDALLSPETEGIWDNYRVKKQFVHLSALITTKLLSVDEVMRAGRNMGGKPQ
jgi:T-complex protein 1 subunit zeta